jgi:hypothetical protein
MRKLLAAVLLALVFCAPRPAYAVCGSAANGTVQPLSYLFATEFPDSLPANSITPGCIRDAIASVGQGNVAVDIDFYQQGLLPAAVAGVPVRIVKTFVRPSVIPTSPTIQCSAMIGATLSTTLTLYTTISGVNTSVGTLVFAAGNQGNTRVGCTATFTTQKTVAAGDELELAFPATADATLASVAVSVPNLQ